jgi:hypothetical protein
MSANIAIFVCDSPAKAITAKAFLEDPSQGYTVTIETVTNSISYDALTFDSGGVDAPTGTQLVIGRK